MVAELDKPLFMSNKYALVGAVAVINPVSEQTPSAKSKWSPEQVLKAANKAGTPLPSHPALTKLVVHAVMAVEPTVYKPVTNCRKQMLQVNVDDGGVNTSRYRWYA